MLRLSSFHLLIRLASTFIFALGVVNWYIQHQEIVLRILELNHANSHALLDLSQFSRHLITIHHDDGPSSQAKASPLYNATLQQPSLRSPYKIHSKTNATNEQPMMVMGACLLVRNDNNLLAEWVAYHYTVLPLRHLIVGCDENATEDPVKVLERWNDTDLTFDVWYSESYTANQQQQPSNHNLGWVALVDTDEYIQLNPLDEMRDEIMYSSQQEEKPYRFGERILNVSLPFLSPNETLSDRIIERKRLRRILGLKRGSKNPITITNLADTAPQQFQLQQQQPIAPTVLDVLEAYSKRHGILPCHSMPRLRYSAVTDNATWLANSICHPKLDSNIISSSINTSQLSTIRFMYHVPLEDFDRNNHAKVLIDVRRVSLESLTKVRNPHKPLKTICAGSYVPEVMSFLHVNHYVNDFQVYSGRKGDVRRDRGMAESWSKSGGAHAKDGVRCDHMHGWLNDFVRTMGMDLAKHLLGQS